MASYPSVGLQYDMRPVTTRRTSISVSGTIRTVDLSQTTVYRISVTHPIIDSTDLSTLQTFYSTNKNNTNAITLGGVTYDTHFESDYQVEAVSASYYNVSVSLIGVEQ